MDEGCVLKKKKQYVLGCDSDMPVLYPPHHEPYDPKRHLILNMLAAVSNGVLGW